MLECVDRVMEDEVGAAWAVVRPPGHHAEVRVVRCVKVSCQDGWCACQVSRFHDRRLVDQDGQVVECFS